MDGYIDYCDGVMEENHTNGDATGMAAAGAANINPAAAGKELGDCRFYEQRFPREEDLVMVKVNRIADLGAYVSLLEYNNIEGMILMNELSKRRFRSVNKLIRVGRHEVVMVLRVDPKKGYIDLSKRRVSPEDIVKCEEKFSKAKKVHQTARHVALKHGMKVEELNRSVIWPLYRRYGHALDALKEAAIRPEEVFAGLRVDDAVRRSLTQDIQLRLAPQAMKLRARVDVWCFGKEGIDAVKEALHAGRDVGVKDATVTVKLIAPPQYVVVTSCFDKELGMVKIEEAMKAISDRVKSSKGGDFKQQGDVVVMGGEEERRLEELLEEVTFIFKKKFANVSFTVGSTAEEEESSEGEDEEDEGMGRVKDDVPDDEIEEDDDEEFSSNHNK